MDSKRLMITRAHGRVQKVILKKEIQENSIFIIQINYYNNILAKA